MPIPGLAGVMAGTVDAFGSGATFYNTVAALGPTSSLKLSLDASDALSYTSGQSWLDRSGGGYDFFRGTTSSATTDDPTFNGTVGKGTANEYWSFDGGDLFRYDTATSETWMDALHQNNARFGWAGWFYVNPTGAYSLFGNTGFSASDLGIKITGDTKQYLTVLTTGTDALAVSSVTTISGTGWHYFAGRVDEQLNTMTFQLDGTQDSQSCTYVSPTAAAAFAVPEIGAIGIGNSKSPSGFRVANFAMWQGTSPTAASLMAIFQSTRGRFGI